jgi:FtsP/CotA-like multicopper oxidase with cupredoxin domain
MSIRSNTPLDAASYYLAPTQPGGQPQRTRFRFLNMSAYSQFFIAFEDHSVHVIEVDGLLLENGATMEKTLTIGFVLGPGQQISVLLQHKTTSEAREKPSQGDPYRILAAVDPRVGPLKSDIEDCHIQPASNPSETMFTWGCLSYTSPDAECKPPTSAEFKMPKFRSMSDQDQELQREPKKRNTLDVPWNDHLHTPYTYPWNFNERLFVP